MHVVQLGHARIGWIDKQFTSNQKLGDPHSWVLEISPDGTSQFVLPGTTQKAFDSPINLGNTSLIISTRLFYFNSNSMIDIFKVILLSVQWTARKRLFIFH